MRTKNDLTEVQQNAITRLYENNATLLVAPTGSGKTVCLLTAIQELIDNEILKRVLIIAPLKVCHSAWSDECKKWDHLQLICCGVATENEKKRLSIINNDIYNVIVVNEENSKWLFNKNLHLNFDGFAIDETSKWTVSGGERFKALRHKVKIFKWRVGMTAQPVSENWTGLFAQILLLDDGRRLGKNKKKFLNSYFFSTDYAQRKWSLLPNGANRICKIIETIVHVMPNYKNALPPKNLSIIYITLDNESEKRYEELRKHRYVEMTADTITAVNSAVLVGKLEQIANGFSYIDNENNPSVQKFILHHSKKLEWVRKRVHNLISKNISVVVVYWYKCELDKLREIFPDALRMAGITQKKFFQNINKFQQKSGQIMLIHPSSCGHGVDGLQKNCCHQLWLAPCWSRDKWQQTQDRLWRQGQNQPVSIEVCIAKNTIDEIKLKSAEWKGNFHELFLKHLSN